MRTTGTTQWRIGAGLAVVLALSGCMEGAGFPGFGAKAGDSTATPAATATQRTVTRDEEAPEVFEVDAEGLWDGRPSLGGIWVAHARVTTPERVLIRNVETDQTVAGALFRRELDNPGPPIQVSAEAAAALGLLAGQPAKLHVVALRRVEVPVAPEPDTATAAPDAAPATGTPVPANAKPKPRPERAGATATTKPAPAPAAPAAATAAPVKPAAAPAITATPLDPLEAAAAAIDKAAATGAQTGTQSAEGAAIDRPWLQLGTYSDEANARDTADKLATQGVAARVATGTHDGKKIWRVLIGPAADRAAMSALTDQARTLGFADAYPVAR